MSLTTNFVAKQLIELSRSLRDMSTETNNQASVYESAIKVLILSKMLVEEGGENEKSS